VKAKRRPTAKYPVELETLMMDGLSGGKCSLQERARLVDVLSRCGADVGELLIRARVAVRWEGRRNEWCGSR
jgi:hypothetical protein